MLFTYCWNLRDRLLPFKWITRILHWEITQTEYSALSQMLASSFLKVQGETRNNTEQLSLNKDGFIVHLLWLEHNRRRRMYHCIMELDAYHQINIISSPQLLNHRAGVWEETNNYIFNPDDDMMQPLITEILWRRQDVEASSSDNWPTSRDITTRPRHSSLPGF